MPSTSACGSDGICIRVMKAAFPVIGPVVQHLTNTSIVNNGIPDTWKQSLVTPIHKAGDPATPSNFRPRTHHSTETALIHTADTLLKATDAGKISLLCLLDMSKAFDVIDHDRLITKLKALGINTDWFEAYLPGHTQRVTFTDSTGTRHTSDARLNTMGVFQGSALGPLLYTLFTNDLSIHAPDSTIIQYADDTQLIISGHKSTLLQVISRMELSLTTLDTWFSANLLKVNPDKTQLIVIGSRQNTHTLPEFTVTFRDRNIQPTDTVKNLGLTFDTNMTWEPQIQQLTKQCYGVLISLSHIRHYLPPCILPALISGLVLSKIRYCLSVYGSGSNKNLHAVQKIINFSSRVIADEQSSATAPTSENGSDGSTPPTFITTTHLYNYTKHFDITSQPAYTAHSSNTGKPDHAAHVKTIN